MEEKDHLKEILGSLDQINAPIDLEAAILKSIQQQEIRQAEIARYQANGFKGLIISAVLITILGILYSLPSSVASIEFASVTYTSIPIVLLLLFIQLEMGGSKIFHYYKNNLS
ncbi:MAG: hypothetical protein AB8G22_24785 [Saprospiraceae bacterium]